MRGSLPERIVGGVACAALVVQQLFVALHLAAEDHDFPGAPAGHAHAHGATARAGHWHDPGPAMPEGRDHEPHPVADHHHPLAKPAPQRTLVDGPVLLPLESVFLVSGAAPRGWAAEIEVDPRPPPPAASASPRAPPVVV